VINNKLFSKLYLLLSMKYAIGILIIGTCLYSFGVIQKILHTPKADAFLLTSKIILGIGTILIVINIFKKSKR
jgi:hypothetical protein